MSELASLPGVSIRYEASTQRLYITADNRALAPHVLRPASPPALRTKETSLGAVVNYSVAAGAYQTDSRWTASQLTGSFEERVFGAFGLLTNNLESAIGGRGVEVVRLDTAWTWSDPRTLISWRGGDLITGGFAWTRSVRMAGLQIRRDFALRPDLVTMASPSITTSAAVPSVAEVMVNGAQVLSSETGAGPLQFRDLPAVQGPSETRVLLRDSLGRETSLVVPFFSSPELLRPGLVDFSAESGFARRAYGTKSADYDSRLVASVSLRAGLTDWSTGELHVEGGGGFAGGGVGQVLRIGGLGVATAALSASQYRGETGAQLALGAQTQLGRFSAQLEYQSTIGQYLDLGAISAPRDLIGTPLSYAAPAHRLVQAGVSTTLPSLSAWGGPALSLTYSAITEASGLARNVWSASLRQNLSHSASMFVTAYEAGAHNGGTGVFAGIAFPFGSSGTASVGVESDQGAASAYADVSHQGGLEPGSTSWRLRAEGGDRQDLEAEAAYRAQFGQGAVAVERLDRQTLVQGRLDGALVLMGGQAFTANRIDNAFALVDVGAPRVPVTVDNRRVGVTDARGQLLVPYLSAYDANTVGIDAAAMPADLILADDHRVATPAAGAGVLVRFKAKSVAAASLLTMRDGRGASLPVGAVGHLADHPAFVVGYDGQTYVEDLRGGEVLKFDLPDGHVCVSHVQGAGAQARATPCT